MTATPVRASRPTRSHIHGCEARRSTACLVVSFWDRESGFTYSLRPVRFRKGVIAASLSSISQFRTMLVQTCSAHALRASQHRYLYMPVHEGKGLETDLLPSHMAPLALLAQGECFPARFSCYQHRCHVAVPRPRQRSEDNLNGATRCINQ